MIVGDLFTKIIAIMICFYLLIIFPLAQHAQNLDDISYAAVYSEANLLIDQARDLGYITADMYEVFLAKVAATGNVYDITIEHLKKIVYPDATSPSGFVVLEDGYYNYDILDQTLFNQMLPDNQQIYYMSKGDTISITIYNTNQTTADAFQFALIGVSSPGPSIYVRVGGVIRNEYH